MITSMKPMVMPIAIRQLVATHGARTPRPLAGPQAPAVLGLPTRLSGPLPAGLRSQLPHTERQSDHRSENSDCNTSGKSQYPGGV